MICSQLGPFSFTHEENHSEQKHRGHDDREEEQPSCLSAHLSRPQPLLRPSFTADSPSPPILTLSCG